MKRCQINSPAVIRISILLMVMLFPFATRTGAQEPPPGWQSESIDLAITLEPWRGMMRGDAVLQLKRLGGGADEIHLTLNHQLRVESVQDNGGRPLPFKQIGDSLYVNLPEPVPAPEPSAIRVRYHGAFHERLPELDLLNAWIGPKIGYAFHSSRWYPQTLDPFRRCPGTVSYLVPSDWTVASSGRLAACETLPGTKRYTFTAARPVEFSFAAAAFVHRREAVNGQDVGVFFLNGDRDKIDFYLKKSVELIRYFKDYYGFFPYDGYSLIELPQALLGKTGAASYEGLTFFPETLLPKRFFYAPVFAHEISHCWWGNCVRGSEGPVINEGLAQMSMGLFLEETLGGKFFWNLLKDGAPQFLYLHSARLFFRSLQTTKVNDKSLEALLMRGEDLELGIPAKDKFTTLHMLSSSKGFFIFAMLRELIGHEAFKQGLRATLEAFSWQTLTLEALRLQFEKASGQELAWFFEQWFMRKGAPEFSISCWFAQRSKHWLVQVMIAQLRDVYRVKAEIAFYRGSAREIRDVEIKARATTFSFLLPFKPQSVRFDPDYKILRWSEQF